MKTFSFSGAGSFAVCLLLVLPSVWYAARCDIKYGANTVCRAHKPKWHTNTYRIQPPQRPHRKPQWRCMHLNKMMIYRTIFAHHRINDSKHSEVENSTRAKNRIRGFYPETESREKKWKKKFGRRKVNNETRNSVCVARNSNKKLSANWRRWPSVNDVVEWEIGDVECTDGDKQLNCSMFTSGRFGIEQAMHKTKSFTDAKYSEN